LYALVDLGVISIASLHNVGASATFTKNSSRLRKLPRYNVINSLMRQLRVEEGNNYAAEEVVRLYPLVERDGLN
jgi:hypothetical protein